MNRFKLLAVCAAFATAACNDSSSPTGVFNPGQGPSFVITQYSANDAGAGPGNPRPNANAAAASFDAAASALRPLKFENLESAPLGNFSSLSLPEMTITLNGTAADADAGITSTPGDAILGYNTSSGGSRHLRLVPPFANGVVTATFTPTVKLQAWGAYFTGVGTVPNTSVEIVFDDGTAQTFAVPGSASGGATFFGFTDPDKIIASVTVRETLTSTSTRDILSIDDIRYAPASGNTQLVPAGEAATVTVQEDGKSVAGIQIPAGTFGVTVLVTVRFTRLATGERCHDYLLDQTGRCLEITARDATAPATAPPLQMPAVVGLCLPANPPALDLFKFKDRTARPVALQRVDAPFLDCTGFQVASAAPSSWLEGLAMGFAKQVGTLISVKSLYAAHSGFGGLIPVGDGLSSFTWASPMPIAHAGLVPNVLNSGKDAWAVRGTFKLLEPKNFAPFAGEVGFDAAAHPVTVGFGNSVYTIPVNSFRYSAELARWVYAARTSSGITAMEINPADGTFTVGATVPTAGPLPAYRAFSVQIGNRAQGVGLRCEATRICVAQEP